MQDTDTRLDRVMDLTLCTVTGRVDIPVRSSGRRCHWTLRLTDNAGFSIRWLKRYGYMCVFFVVIVIFV